MLLMAYFPDKWKQSHKLDFIEYKINQILIQFIPKTEKYNQV